MGLLPVNVTPVEVFEFVIDLLVWAVVWLAGADTGLVVEATC